MSSTRLSALSPEWPNKQAGMVYRRLGRTDFMVSRMVMGGNSIKPGNHRLVLEALDRGLNYLDTAPAYGRGESEKGLAEVIKARGRDNFFLNTKVSLWDQNRNRIYQEIFESLPKADQTRLKDKVDSEIEERGTAEPDNLVNYFSGQLAELKSATLCNLMEEEFGGRIDRDKNYKELILSSVDESLARLGTDYVDILMCPHGASTPYEILHYPEIGEAFEILRKAGKVRYLGVSAHTDPAGILRAAVEAEIYSVAMVAYNIINHRSVENGLKIAHENDLGVVAMKVARPVHPGVEAAEEERARIMHNALEGPWSTPQKAYLWALQSPYLSAVISDLVDEEMVKSNLRLVQNAPA